ncbi:multi-copper polyphenol oxidoreductase [Crenothrix sp. D3]|nr:multi-copper polyphenol oxidoreductase [Crenothrix sp. D3]
MNHNKHWITPDWPAPANIHAATTLRTGGVSVTPYDSLNPATHVGDDEDCVRENRQRIKTMLALPSEPVWLEQTHSNLVINAGQATTLQQADASVSDQAGVVCAVLTADCLPLLICSTDGQQIAAIHAGWKGLLAGIITNTINVLATTEVLVWLGPAIGAACFEVGAEVREVFVAKSAVFASAFTQTNTNKYLADIYQLARIELATLGIHAVYGGEFCTVTDQARFYSYRRDTQTGRLATLIWRT